MNKYLDTIKRKLMFWQYTKITINYNDEAKELLDKICKEQNKNMSQVCEDLLRRYIATNK